MSNPSFQRRHYETIAASIKETIERTEKVDADLVGTRYDRLLGIKRTAWTLAETFKADNPRFEQVRFIKACGISEDEI